MKKNAVKQGGGGVSTWLTGFQILALNRVRGGGCCMKLTVYINFETFLRTSIRIISECETFFFGPD